MIQKLTITRWFRRVIFFSLLAFTIVFLLGMITVSHIVKNDEQETVHEIMQQITTLNARVLDKAISVAQYLSFSNVTMDYLTCEDEFDLISKKELLDDVTASLLSTEDQIDNILIYRSTHRIPYSARSLVDSPAFYAFAEEQEQENLARYDFSVVRQKAENSSTMYSYPVFSQKIINTHIGNGYGAFLGTLSIVLDPTYLNVILRSVNSRFVKQILVLDTTENEVMAQTGKSSLIHLNTLKTDEYIYWENIEKTDWAIGCIMDRRQIYVRYVPIFLCMFVMAFLVLFIIVVIYYVIYHSFTMPLSNLIKAIDKLAEKPGERLALYGVKDIDRLAKHVNQLLDRCDAQASKMLKLEKRQFEIAVEKKISELYVLENQISPHFLLNTLTCIGGMAIIHHVPEIARLVTGISSICHYSIRKADTVCLQDEIDNIQAFFNIVDARSPGSYSLNIQVQESLRKLSVPKMTLQPLIENAIYHGLEQQGCGDLTVSAYREKNTLYITIQDNGIGIQNEEVHRIQEQLNSSSQLEYLSLIKKKVGIVNLCRRIKLIYGEEYGIRVESELGRGTLMEVSLPAKEMESQNSGNTSFR